MRKPTASKDVNSFISGAESTATVETPEKASKAKFKRETFSLTYHYSDLIDELADRALEHKDKQGKRLRVNRSEVIKAGLKALDKLSDKQFAKMMSEVKEE